MTSSMLRRAAAALSWLAWCAAHGASARRSRAVLPGKPQPLPRAAAAIACAGVFAPWSDARTIWAMLTSSWMNLLLLSIPVGIVSGFREMNPTLVFVSVS